MPGTSRLVLVDADDRPVGEGDKLDVHRTGVLHRAFSIFVVDDRHRLLLQRRARAKYHSPGRWANTCCGHPAPGEPLAEAAARRLQDEMGFRCPLRAVGRFTYREELDRGMIEHEVDHVFWGRFAGVPRPNPIEVDAWEWREMAAVAADVQARPERYAAWFAPALAVLRARVPDLAAP